MYGREGGGGGFTSAARRVPLEPSAELAADPADACPRVPAAQHARGAGRVARGARGEVTVEERRRPFALPSA
jgi:hypothetical protein